MIATASTEDKRALALELGADAAVDVTREDLADALRGGQRAARRVDVVLEMAGGRVFDACLDALAPFGRLVTYGIASREPNEVATGAPDAPQPRRSSASGSCTASRRPQEMVDAPLRDLFARAARGELRVVEGERPTRSPRRAARTRTSQARRTTGKLLLDPAR